MRDKKSPLLLGVTLAIFVFMASSWAATEKKLHNFGISHTDGTFPQTILISDAAGNLYGNTVTGGDYGVGTVFELIPDGNGDWTEKKLHSFGRVETDGANPRGGLIFDTAGNLYGTASAGGDYEYGTVYELMPDGSGGWTEKTLHSFRGVTDGLSPACTLVFDADGNLYGTTYEGGNFSCGGVGCGMVFELTPNGHGGWTEKKLHTFGINDRDGTGPQAGLIFDAVGNLYGTTPDGGNYGRGTVFELTPDGSGRWIEKKLHNFGLSRRDGTAPEAGLVFDADGNPYGTTAAGGDYNQGTAFQLTPDGRGAWTEKKLHNFGINGKDGGSPGGIVLDAAGKLYGITEGGGDYPCGGFGCGTVFELAPDGHGGWAETKLHNFGSYGTDGQEPSRGLLIDAAGNLYGTTSDGGDYNQGILFKINP